MIIENIKIENLKAALYNPRTATAKQASDLQKSLEKFGLIDPIILNRQTKHIIGGHFRVREME